MSSIWQVCGEHGVPKMTIWRGRRAGLTPEQIIEGWQKRNAAREAKARKRESLKQERLQGQTVSGLAREMGVSRTTIRRMLRQGYTADTIRNMKFKKYADRDSTFSRLAKKCGISRAQVKFLFFERKWSLAKIEKFYTTYEGKALIFAGADRVPRRFQNYRELARFAEVSYRGLMNRVRLGGASGLYEIVHWADTPLPKKRGMIHW